MARTADVLSGIRIAAPCSASWAAMRGDERVRFCDACKLNVYNLSDLSKREAEELVSRREGRLCVRFCRRGDGTVLTDNCPVGPRAARRQWRRVISGYAALFAMLVTAAGFAAGRDGRVPRLRHVQPFAKLCDWLSPTPAPITGRFIALGYLAAPRTNAAAAILKQLESDRE